MDESNILNLIESDSFKMKALEAVRSLDLPDWVIGVGFVRNPIWNHLHGYENNSPSTDIDVAYFDPIDFSEETEARHQVALKEILPADWSVTNQARMARINNQPRNYTSTKDAISHWPETATAIGITMLKNGELELVAPYGIEDLISLTLRMTPEFGDGAEAFRLRIEKKQWILKWPKLKVIRPDSHASASPREKP